MPDDSSDPARAALYEGMDARQDDEYARLGIQHTLHMDAMGGELVKVPDLPKNVPIKILDSATGDGRWMVDVAAVYPSATLLGTDIIPKHFTQIKGLPARISFEIQSVLEPWPLDDQSAFDLVHQRFCFASFKPEDSAAATKRLFNLVKPGKFIQLVDGDLLGFDRDGHPAFAKMMDFIERAFAQGGMNPIPGRSLKPWLEAAGATDVVAQEYEFGLGVKAGTPEKQKQTTANIMGMIDNFAMIGSKMPNYWYTADDFKKLRQELAAELQTQGNTWRFWVVVAKRPA
ncbi:MAG: hypothetical protein M1830_001176 [Pleopsidium flavum]|nr:MAG: hypothetical protein M1830_001176 [Pleopsidium flavum]